MIAVGSHSRKLTSFLLEESADVKYINGDDSTALSIAVQSGNLFAIEELVAHGALLSTCAWDGTNLLELAIESANLEIFHYLWGRGLDPNEANVWGGSVANRAIKHIPFRSYLLNTDRCLGLTTSPVNIFSWAADRDDTVLIKLLYRSMDSSAAAGALDGAAGSRAGHGQQQKHQDVSPLCAAARAGHVECVELLLSLGADMEKEGCEDGTAIMAAAAFGRLGVVKTLLRRGAGKEGAETEYCKDENAAGMTRRSLLHAARGAP